MGSLRRFVRSLFARDQATRDVDDEIRFHLEMEEQKLIERGVEPAEARRQARLRFGGEQKWRHEVRDVDGIGPIERVRADARFGFRVLRRNPVFAFVSIATLALGIGASTAIFSVVDGILLRALPYPASEELVTVWADYTGRGGPEREWWGYPNFFDTRRATTLAIQEPGASPGDAVFEDLAMWSPWNPTLTSRGETARAINGAQVSDGMLSRILRVQPVLGSIFRPGDHVANAPPVVLLSERFWRNDFAGDPQVLGTTLALNGMDFEVIGVLPAEFRQPLVSQAEIWSPLGFDETNFPGGRGSARIRVLGRLAPGVELEQARARIDQVAATLEQSFPEDMTGIGQAAFPLKDDIVSGARSGLLLLLGAVVATLLIVCINLANLLLARGSARTREFSVRAALGASGWRLARQLLTESVLLSALGGLLGVGLAIVGTRLLVALAPPGTPRLEEVGVDWRVLGFAAAVSIACGLFFGLLPALQATRVQLAERMGRHRRSGERVAEGLVTAQVGAALVLLLGAVLLAQSFTRLTSSNLGYRPEGMVSAFVFGPPSLYETQEQADQMLQQLHEDLRSVPGASAVARVDTLPLAGFDGDLSFLVEGEEIPAPGEENISWFRRATPDYFATAGIEVKAGRVFDDAVDHSEAPRVVMINETLANQHFGGLEAVGKRININSPDNPRWREIIGVVSDVKNFDLREDPRPAMYAPFTQVPGRAAFFVLRSDTLDTDGLLEATRARIAQFDPNLAPTYRTASSYVENARALDRFVTWLLGLFAVVAVILAAIGLYGIVNYRVHQRVREIGLRLALGAQARAEGARIVTRCIVVAGVGVALGVAVAMGAVRALDSLLYGVTGTEPATYALVAGVMVAVAALAGLLPAWRAARLDPVQVLREE